MDIIGHRLRTCRSSPLGSIFYTKYIPVGLILRLCDLLNCDLNILWCRVLGLFDIFVNIYSSIIYLIIDTTCYYCDCLFFFIYNFCYH